MSVAARDTEPLDVGSLLTIDVASEIRKVPGAGIEGTWQLPAELVRGALRTGAREVAVHVGRRHIEIRSDGSGFPLEALEALASLAGEQRPAGSRHRALLRLEACQALELAALLAHTRNGLIVESRQADRRFIWSRASGPRIARLADDRAGLRIRAEGVEIDRWRAVGWLEVAGRYAPARIQVAGRPLPRGFAGSLTQSPLAPPYQGCLSIPRDAEHGQVWLLQDGIVAARVTLPAQPCFEAAVEMAGLAPRAGSAGALREALAPHLDALAAQAADRMFALCRGAAALSAGDAVRARLRLLSCARLRHRRSELLSSPVFPGYSGPAGSRRWFSMLDLGSSPGPDRERVWDALFPHQHARGFLMPRGPVVVLSTQERAVLTRLLGVRFRSPDPTAAVPSFYTRAHEWLAAMGHRAVRAFQRLRHPRLRPLADSEMNDLERRLLRLLRGALGEAPGPRVSISGGGGAIVRLGGRRPAVFLPRENPLVKAAGIRVARDTAWLYPVALSLLDGADPAQHLRDAWRQRPPLGLADPGPTHPRSATPLPDRSGGAASGSDGSLDPSPRNHVSS